MGREARAREERTPYENISEQIAHVEDLVKQLDDVAGARQTETIAALQKLGTLIATQVSQATIDSLPTYTLTICGLKVLTLKPR